TKQMATLQEAADQAKVKLASAAMKKEIEDVTGRLNEFEKHMGNIIDLLTKRADEMPREIDQRFKRLEASMNDAFTKNLKKAKQAEELIEKIEKEAPRIAKELAITDKLKDVEVKKIESKPGEDMKENVAETNKEKVGFFARLFQKKEKK
ncbi:MAG: hypothetical protein HGA85_07760, partial [Nanoarchaeota archaeon]|nr:hypothetical protein [Nanoarchaeota archaeon]